MPIHGDENFVIPKCQFARPPKNIMDFSSKKMNGFLNRHQAEIEQIAYQFPKNTLAKWMIIHNMKYFNNYDILNHDNFYNAKFNQSFSDVVNRFKNEILYSHKNTQLNMGFIMGNQGTRGGASAQSEILTEAQGSNALGTGMGGDIFGMKAQSAATIGNWISQIACKMTTSAGSQRLGVYTDNSNSPNALVGYTDAIALDTSYSYNNLNSAPITITVATMWTYAQTNTNSSSFGGTTSGMSGAYPVSGWAFGVPNSSWGTSGSRTAIPATKFKGI